MAVPQYESNKTLAVLFRDIGLEFQALYGDSDIMLSRENYQIYDRLLKIGVDPLFNDAVQQINLFEQVQKLIAFIDEIKNHLANSTVNPNSDSLADSYVLEAYLPDEAVEKNKKIRDFLEGDILTLVKEKVLLLPPENNLAFSDLNNALKNVIDDKIKHSPLAILGDPKNFRYKKMEKFSQGNVLDKDEGSGLFSHATQKITKQPEEAQKAKKKHKTTWYSKYCENKITAAREVVAQEFFRLIMPYQPKTRLAKNNEDELFVLSQETPNCSFMEKMSRIQMRENFNKKKYSGLGAVMTTAIFLNETDLKFGNMLINEQGKVVKIDGDWCFSKLRDPARFTKGSTITADDIASLPAIKNYVPHNFTDAYRQGVKNSKYALNPEETYIDRELARQPEFRREVNETLLNILLMPKEFMQDFVKAYINDQSEVEIIAKEMSDRFEQLYVAAMGNNSFLLYLQSNDAEQHVKNCCDKITTFKPASKITLVSPENKEPVSQHIFQRFSTLQVIAKKIRGDSLPELKSPASKKNENSHASLTSSNKVLGFLTNIIKKSDKGKAKENIAPIDADLPYKKFGKK